MISDEKLFLAEKKASLDGVLKQVQNIVFIKQGGSGDGFDAVIVIMVKYRNLWPKCFNHNPQLTRLLVWMRDLTPKTSLQNRKIWNTLSCQAEFYDS